MSLNVKFPKLTSLFKKIWKVVDYSNSVHNDILLLECVMLYGKNINKSET